MAKRKDPRECKTVKEAAENPDGSFDGARMLSWYLGLSVKDCVRFAKMIVDGKTIPKGGFE